MDEHVEIRKNGGDVIAVAREHQLVVEAERCGVHRERLQIAGVTVRLVSSAAYDEKPCGRDSVRDAACGIEKDLVPLPWREVGDDADQRSVFAEIEFPPNASARLRME